MPHPDFGDEPWTERLAEAATKATASIKEAVPSFGDLPEEEQRRLVDEVINESFDPPARARSVLEEAHDLVTDTNMTRFGPPARSFNRVAEWWSTYTGCPLGAHDVAMMMALFKMARARAGIETDGEPPRGALVDLAGFVACSDEMLD